MSPARAAADTVRPTIDGLVLRPYRRGDGPANPAPLHPPQPTPPPPLPPPPRRSPARDRALVAASGRGARRPPPGGTADRAPSGVGHLVPGPSRWQGCPHRAGGLSASTLLLRHGAPRP